MNQKSAFDNEFAVYKQARPQPRHSGEGRARGRPLGVPIARQRLRRDFLYLFWCLKPAAPLPAALGQGARLLPHFGSPLSTAEFQKEFITIYA